MVWSVVLDFLRKYWSYILLSLVIIFGYWYFTANNSSWTAKYKELTVSHDKEITEINAARDEERKAHEVAVKELEAKLSAVQAQYEAESKKLAAEKVQVIQHIIQEHGTDPDTLAQMLNDALDGKVVEAAK